LGEPGDYKFDPRFEPKKPHVFVHLYNNHWRTNFRAWISDGRRMTSRVRLWSFDQFDAEAALYSPAMETRIPLAAVRSTALPGKLPGVQSGITLSRKGVAVTAFGPNPDSSGIVLRLWEQSGTSGLLSVTLPIGLKATKAQPVNLRGEKTGNPIAIINGKLALSLPAYAPVSFLLDL
jgi:alpha-mannosidase